MAIDGRQSVDQLGVMLIVRDVVAAIGFYRDVLGAVEICRHTALLPTDPPGDVVHSAELKLGDAYLVVAKENPRWPEAPRPDWPRSPQSAGAPSAVFMLYVDDVDDVLARAIAAGAEPQTADGAQDTYWGDRVVQFHDPSGHVWRIQTRLEDVAPEELAQRFEAQRAARRSAAR